MLNFLIDCHHPTANLLNFALGFGGGWACASIQRRLQRYLPAFLDIGPGAGPSFVLAGITYIVALNLSLWLKYALGLSHDVIDPTGILAIFAGGYIGWARRR